eukprot:CAMPEP_0173401104 /NCGR_PEP_ID=MMETSP1356-20130122/49920_1 /TAXON_ID=77927 ORGANISM="Hemiselmis virescens, Strain PCC157" /NCGR_SAMPLE_ID=MMETSP1356 /ASSEMBLY_ACC=CAM_ASM_000847 /LENGTH=124 /DNA_ID=CAMNT_0014361167 /DNA_START=259 /DNA_END=630 /DNA_ORIENTATION=-
MVARFDVLLCPAVLLLLLIPDTDPGTPCHAMLRRAMVLMNFRVTWGYLLQMCSKLTGDILTSSQSLMHLALNTLIACSPALPSSSTASSPIVSPRPTSTTISPLPCCLSLTLPVMTTYSASATP